MTKLACASISRALSCRENKRCRRISRRRRFDGEPSVGLRLWPAEGAIFSFAIGLSMWVGMSLDAGGVVQASPPVAPVDGDRKSELQHHPGAFTTIAAAIAPSVVRIEVIGGESDRDGRRPGGSGPSEGRDGHPPFLAISSPAIGSESNPASRQEAGLGAGFVWDSFGDIITSRHLVHGAIKMKVTLYEGDEYAAKVIGSDAQTDIAVLRLDDRSRSLIAATIGDSDMVQVGEWVLAVGSPLGLERTITAGIVSGRGGPGRHARMSDELAQGYLQTDLDLNSGDTGGPLVNLEGQVIGVNTLVEIGNGGSFGFAVPANQMSRVVREILEEGQVRRPSLGMMFSAIRDLEPRQEAKCRPKSRYCMPRAGAYVARLAPAAMARASGVHVGDVIVAIDGDRIEGPWDAIDCISRRRVGSKVIVRFWRAGKLWSTSATLGESPGSTD